MDKLSKRGFLKSTRVLVATAVVPTSAVAIEEGAAASETRLSSPDLIDKNFESTSGRHSGSQVIHHGEHPGFQVTPISQDKAAPSYQRPGNLKNPTVATLLRKVIGRARKRNGRGYFR